MKDLFCLVKKYPEVFAAWIIIIQALGEIVGFIIGMIIAVVEIIQYL